MSTPTAKEMAGILGYPESLAKRLETTETPQPPTLLEWRAAVNVINMYRRYPEAEVLEKFGQEELTRLQHAQAVEKAFKENGDCARRGKDPEWYVDSKGVARMFPDVACDDIFADETEAVAS